MESITTRSLPATWEIEWRVIEFASECFGVPRSEVDPTSRLIEDLHGDSLDMVDFIMTVEAYFEIEISKELMQGLFVSRRPVTIAAFSELVVGQWGTGRPDRKVHKNSRSTLPIVDSAPMTQLDAKCAAADWQMGPLHQSLGLNREGYTEYRRATDGMRCIAIPAGVTTIGNAAPGALRDQSPVHSVQVSAFLLDAEPVCNLAYCSFLNSLGKLPELVLQEWCGTSADDHRGAQYPLKQGFWNWRPISRTEHQPMILVSWFGANAYALWANRLDWRAYRGDGQVVAELAQVPVAAPMPASGWMHSQLPSEAQWEYAARGSAVPNAAYQSDAETSACVARHQVGETYTAESLPAVDVNRRMGMSPFGVHHIAGNVWQWCRDWYAADFYSSATASDLDPQGTVATGIRSERGGSWVGPAELSHPAYRRGRPPIARGRCLGFRCASQLARNGG